MRPSGSSAAIEPTVDVVIPTRNRLALTREALRSVIDQTYEHWTVWIVDDGSEQECARALDALSDEDRRVEVVHLPERRGPAAARQAGLHAGVAPFVATLDSDDLWHPTKLTRQVEAFTTSRGTHAHVGAVLCGHEWVHDGVAQKARTPPPHSESPLVSNNLSTPLLSRPQLEAAGGFAATPPLRATGCEHIECYIRWSAHFSFAAVQELLVTCRGHRATRESDQLGSIDAATDLEEVLLTYQDVLRHHPDDSARLRAAVGARFVDAGADRRGVHEVARALRAASPKTALALLREYGPFVTRAIAIHRIHRTPSARS